MSIVRWLWLCFCTLLIQYVWQEVWCYITVVTYCRRSSAVDTYRARVLHEHIIALLYPPIPVGARLSAPVQICPGAQPSLLYDEYRVCFPGVKRPGRGINHPPPSSTEVKERVELYLYSPSGPARPVVGWAFTLRHSHAVQTHCICLNYCPWLFFTKRYTEEWSR
jgi:hypothetical protein